MVSIVDGDRASVEKRLGFPHTAHRRPERASLQGAGVARVTAAQGNNRARPQSVPAAEGGVGVGVHGPFPWGWCWGRSWAPYQTRAGRRAREPGGAAQPAAPGAVSAVTAETEIRTCCQAPLALSFLFIIFYFK